MKNKAFIFIFLLTLYFSGDATAVEGKNPCDAVLGENTHKTLTKKENSLKIYAHYLQNKLHAFEGNFSLSLNSDVLKEGYITLEEKYPILNNLLKKNEKKFAAWIVGLESKGPRELINILKERYLYESYAGEQRESLKYWFEYFETSYNSYPNWMIDLSLYSITRLQGLNRDSNNWEFIRRRESTDTYFPELNEKALKKSN